MRTHDETLIWKTLTEGDQLPLPGMKLPDAREGHINILINQLVNPYFRLFRDKDRVIDEIIQSLEKSNVEYSDEDAHLVVAIVNKRAREHDTL